MSATIDFRIVTREPMQYDVVCSEHGTLAERSAQPSAVFRAAEHDGHEHRGAADWLYDGDSILDGWGEPSPAESPAAKAVDARTKKRAAQDRLL